MGKDNLIVKTHPRDTRDVYTKNGIKIMKDSNAPWEVIQLNMGESDSVLLTVNSGAFISIMALMENKRVKGFFC